MESINLLKVMAWNEVFGENFATIHNNHLLIEQENNWKFWSTLKMLRITSDWHWPFNLFNPFQCVDFILELLI